MIKTIKNVQFIYKSKTYLHHTKKAAKQRCDVEIKIATIQFKLTTHKPYIWQKYNALPYSKLTVYLRYNRKLSEKKILFIEQEN